MEITRYLVGVLLLCTGRGRVRGESCRESSPVCTERDHTVFYGIPDHDGIPDHFPGYVQEKKSVLLGLQNIF